MSSDVSAGPEVRRQTTVLIGAVVFGTIALYAAYTGGTLAAVQLTGGRTLSGLPGAAAILGTAGGAALLSSVMARAGYRRGLVLGWSVGAVGGALAVAAMVLSSFVLLVLAMVVIGFGHGANQMSRYAAAALHPMARRGSVLSLVVWVSTIGAVIGPLLLGPAGVLGERGGLSALAGGFVVVAAAFVVAGVVGGVLLRVRGKHRGSTDGAAPANEAVRWDRLTVLGVVALITAQFVMVWVMTVTPVHMAGHQHNLGTVGAVMSAHVLGMFGLAPVFGRAVDRLGSMPVTVAGLVVVTAASLVAGLAPPTSSVLLGAALLALGLGWSATFVSSSALVSRTTVTVQGRVEAMGWSLAAVAASVAGIVLGLSSYLVVCAVGVVVTLVALGLTMPALRRPQAATSS